MFFFGQCSPKKHRVVFDLEHELSQVPCLCSSGEKCQLCVNNPVTISKSETVKRDNETKHSPEFLWYVIYSLYNLCHINCSYKIERSTSYSYRNERKGKYLEKLFHASIGILFFNATNVFLSLLILMLMAIIVITISKMI